jgi:G3E family GTPase
MPLNKLPPALQNNPDNDIDLNKVLMTKKFNFEEAQSSDKWFQELQKAPSSEIQEYGFSSFAFNSRKPFNPEKFFNLMNTNVFKDVVRAKGYIWLATNFYVCGMLNVVGEIKTVEPQTIWWSAVKKSKWGNNKKEIELVEKSVEAIWDPVYGDRRIEIVFIGQKLNKSEITKSLEDCLITDEEFKLGDMKWEEMFTDPFTEWQKVLRTHPMKNNFKQRDGEWEDEDDIEDEEVEEQK